MNLPLNHEQLIGRIPAESFNYLFFWGHHEDSETPTKACLSQWYASSFTVDGKEYATAEHFMMSRKARLFKDERCEEQIIACSHPSEAKKMGRMIANFDENIWNQHKFAIVVQASVEKFSQNPPLLAFLLSTSNRILVEASPADPIWGIGLAQDHRDATDPKKWKGPNLLGFALMTARAKFLTALKS